MISRRSIVQHTSDKASNNWADEAGMRDFIAAGFLPFVDRVSRTKPFSCIFSRTQSS